MTERTRMIVDIPREVQMAIRLRAVKDGITTGAVVEDAIFRVFRQDIDEAKVAIAEAMQQKGPS